MKRQYEKETGKKVISFGAKVWDYITWLEDRTNKLYDEKEYLWTTTIAANDKKIHELEDKLRWRDASKELPPIHEDRLSSADVLFYHRDSDKVYCGYLHSNGWWYDLGQKMHSEPHGVTHWLPIPKPEVE